MSIYDNELIMSSKKNVIATFANISVHYGLSVRVRKDNSTLLMCGCEQRQQKKDENLYVFCVLCVTKG